MNLKWRQDLASFIGKIDNHWHILDLEMIKVLMPSGLLFGPRNCGVAAVLCFRKIMSC